MDAHIRSLNEMHVQSRIYVRLASAGRERIHTTCTLVSHYPVQYCGPGANTVWKVTPWCKGGWHVPSAAATPRRNPAPALLTASAGLASKR